jgi:hypothetical protein
VNRLQRLGALAGLLGVLALAGCSDDDPVEPDPAPSADGTDASSSPTDTATTTESAEPVVEPASGPEMAGDNAAMRAPEGYQVSEFGFGIFNAEQRGTTLTLADLGQVAISTPRQLAGNGLENFRGRPEVSYDAELGGEPAYEAVGRDSSGPYVEYGSIRGGNAVLVSFAFPAGASEDEQDALIASVLASFSWT